MCANNLHVDNKEKQQIQQHPHLTIHQTSERRDIIGTTKTLNCLKVITCLRENIQRSLFFIDLYQKTLTFTNIYFILSHFTILISIDKQFSKFQKKVIKSIHDFIISNIQNQHFLSIQSNTKYLCTKNFLYYYR